MRIRTPSIAVAVGLLILAPVLGIGVAAIGGLAHVAEGPPVQQLAARPTTTFSLCPQGGYDCWDPYSDQTVLSVFIAPAGLSLLVVGQGLAGGSIDEISPAGRLLANMSAPCEPNGAFYSGSGDLALITCEAYHLLVDPNGSEHTVFEAQVLVFNWSSHAIAGVWDLNSSEPCDYYASTLGAGGTELFCGTGYPETSVRVLDVRSGSILENISIPSAPYYLATVIVWDGSADRLLLESTDGTHLLVIDPRMGSVDRSLAFPGRLGPAGWDPETGRLFVGWTNATVGSEYLFGGNITVLNATDLRPLSIFPVAGLGSSLVGGFFPDPVDGLLLVTPDLTVVNVSSGATLGAIPDPMGWLREDSAITFDAATGSFLFVGTQSYPGGSEVNVTFPWVSAPPFATVPFVGSSVPIVVSLVPAIVGSAFLVPEIPRAVRARRAAWSDGSPLDRTMEAAKSSPPPSDRR